MLTIDNTLVFVLPGYIPNLKWGVSVANEHGFELLPGETGGLLLKQLDSDNDRFAAHTSITEAVFQDAIFTRRIGACGLANDAGCLLDRMVISLEHIGWTKHLRRNTLKISIKRNAIGSINVFLGTIIYAIEVIDSQHERVAAAHVLTGIEGDPRVRKFWTSPPA